MHSLKPTNMYVYIYIYVERNDRVSPQTFIKTCLFGLYAWLGGGLNLFLVIPLYPYLGK